MVYAYPILPYAGLGNMLLPWARAVAFCHRNKAAMIGPYWTQIPHLGPWLRREKCKRFYGTDFENTGYVVGLSRWWKLRFTKSVTEDEWSQDTGCTSSKDLIVKFAKFGGDKGFFEQISDVQDIVAKELWRIVTPTITLRTRRLLDAGKYIGVHVRRGDFSSLGIAASDEWYVKAVGKALELADGMHECIRVFSDARSNELQFLHKAFPCERIEIMPKAPAIQDILSLSQSSVLVASPESTFSMWAVFCGQMPSIWRCGCHEHGIYRGLSKVVYV